ncbi:MAG TPA: 50S ribosomal protein L11 methyltransferase [Thermodesulfobacteriota bacterium]|nr:50S ribosomal protein L11 methyltransferase [Thermodesulfobacteriota bacterium]
MRQWIVLNFLIPREFQESISNFLIEQGTLGFEEVEENSNGVMLKAYFLKDGEERTIFQALSRYLRSLENVFQQKIPYQMETTLIAEQDWGENWKRFFKPVSIGARLIVFPPWERVRLKRGQIPIEITPGMAFGTGTHATTQLCIEALETRLRKGATVLDVGTGSGILAIVAAKLGAQEVWGIDIDQVAVEGARENVEKNGVSGIVRVRKGGLGRIQKRFDIVIANIDFKNLKRLGMPLLRHLNDQGLLILSGLLKEQGDQIRQHYLETKALRFIKVAHQGEWACLVFIRMNPD